MPNFNNFSFLGSVAKARDELVRSHKLPYRAPNFLHDRKDVVRLLDAFLARPRLATNFHVMRAVLDAAPGTTLYELRDEFEQNRRKSVGKSNGRALANADIGVACLPRKFPFEPPLEHDEQSFFDAICQLVDDMRPCVLDLARTGCDEPAEWPKSVSSSVETLVGSKAFDKPQCFDQLKELICADGVLSEQLNQSANAYYPHNANGQAQLTSITCEELYLTTIANSDIWQARGGGGKPGNNWRGFLLEQFRTIMQRRHEDIKNRIIPPVQGLPQGGVVCDERDAVSNAIRREDRDRLRAALKQLTNKERDVLHRHIVQESSPQAIADDDHVSVDEAKQAIQSALEKLKERFDNGPIR